jgi:hypothetical protein
MNNESLRKSKEKLLKKEKENGNQDPSASASLVL